MTSALIREVSETKRVGGNVADLGLGMLSPTGGDAWRTYRQTIPSGSQNLLQSVALQGGVIVTVVVSFAAPLELANQVQSVRIGADWTGRLGAGQAEIGVIGWPALEARQTIAATEISEVGRRISAEEQVDAIQDALSLTVADMAKVLRVSRPTIYAWLRGNVAAPRDGVTAERLRSVYRLASEWKEQSDLQPGRFVRVPIQENLPSLFDLLCASTLDEKAIREVMSGLTQVLAQRYRERMAGARTRVWPSSESNAAEREYARAVARRARLGGR